MTLTPIEPDTDHTDVKVLWRGTLPEYQTNIVSRMFWPLAVSKRVMQGIYDALIQTIWSELIHGERQDQSATSVLGAGLLAVFAIVIYQGRAYEDWVILGLGLVWVVDWWLSKSGFRHPARMRRSVVSLTGKGLEWKSAARGAASGSAHIPVNRIDYIALDCQEVRLGVFDNRVGQVWRGLLVLDDGEGYGLFDEPDVNKTMQLAEKAAQTFKTRLVVSDSLGESPLATDQRFNRALFLLDRDKTISTRSVGAKVRIDKRLSLATAPLYMGRVLQEAGFPLFLLIIYFMLLRVGALLSALLHPMVGIPAEPVVIDLSAAGIAGFFVPDFDWLRFLEFGAALAFIGFKAWRFSRPLMIHVDENTVLTRIGKKPLGQLRTETITDILLVREPRLTLLLIDDRRRVIEINSLETEFEYKHVMARLIDAVFAAQRKPKLAADQQAA